jgi:glycosyltransferase involved in cell wall biosynthesis
MPRLFATATHYVSLSHGEGWDQAMVEAAATGLRLIAPDHSAYRAYLDPSVAQLIGSREVPAMFGGGGAIGKLFENAHWWEPDEDEAVACVRRAIEGRDADKPPPRERILSELTWEAATRRLIAILVEAEQVQPSASARPESNSF